MMRSRFEDQCRALNGFASTAKSLLFHKLALGSACWRRDDLGTEWRYYRRCTASYRVSLATASFESASLPGRDCRAVSAGACRTTAICPKQFRQHGFGASSN
jgi:hypothetical protein